MNIEEYGRENKDIIVMLHGANFVHCFGKQYVLSEKYHLIVPHIMGYGREADNVFNAEAEVQRLAEYISSFGKKVMLVGFSLGAQLAVMLAARHSELFSGVIAVSPWLIKEPAMVEKVMQMNMKQFGMFRKKTMCRMVGFMNGLRKQQLDEFIEQMQNVKEATVRNSVDNGITLESLSGFEKIDFPVLLLAGGKEQNEVTDSIRRLAEMNNNCTAEVWERAAHNIPPLYAKQFNERIEEMAGRVFQ